MKIYDPHVGQIMANTYKGKVTGREYMFQQGSFVEVDDRDGECFLKSGFKKWGVVEKVTMAVTGKNPIAPPKPKVSTYAELKALTKKEQTNLIRKLGGTSISIPSTEDKRIELIVKLQGGVKSGGKA